MAKKETPLTEGQLVDRLRTRYEGESGNGPAGCLIPQVRDAAGFDANRTIDALGFHFWPSRGMLIDAYECKSSRSDWMREVENPAKADRFCALADRFYVVVGRADLAKIDEVPPDWGLLVPHGENLKEVKPALVLHRDSPAVVEWAARAGGRRASGPRPLPGGFDRSFLVAIVRQAFKVSKVTPQEVSDAEAKGFKAGTDYAEGSVGHELKRLREIAETVNEFEEAVGAPIRGWRNWAYGEDDVAPADVGRTVRQVLNGEADVTKLRNRLNAAANEAERLAKEARGHVESLESALAQEEGRLVA